MPASRERVIRSPRLAAMGVATLSGLMPTFLDAMMTPIMMRPTIVSIRVSCHLIFPWAFTIIQKVRSNVTDNDCTEDERSNEGSGNAGGAQQHGMTQPEVSLWDPAKDHSSYGSQEPHHCRLDLHKHTHFKMLHCPVQLIYDTHRFPMSQPGYT